MAFIQPKSPRLLTWGQPKQEDTPGPGLYNHYETFQQPYSSITENVNPFNNHRHQHAAPFNSSVARRTIFDGGGNGVNNRKDQDSRSNKNYENSPQKTALVYDPRPKNQPNNNQNTNDQPNNSSQTIRYEPTVIHQTYQKSAASTNSHQQMSSMFMSTVGRFMDGKQFRKQPNSEGAEYQRQLQMLKFSKLAQQFQKDNNSPIINWPNPSKPLPQHERYSTEPSTIQRPVQKQRAISQQGEKQSSINKQDNSSSSIKPKTANRPKTHSKTSSNYQNQKQPTVRLLMTNPNNTELRSFYTLPQAYKSLSSIVPSTHSITNQSNISSKTSKGILNWSKSKEQRFLPNNEAIRKPGPGAYNHEQSEDSPQLKPSSSFAYSGLRSHLDNVIYETSNPIKVEILKQVGAHSQRPGPGHYDTKITRSKSFNQVDFNFGSAADRFAYNIFQQKPEDAIGPGPGTYSLQNGIKIVNENKQKQLVRRQKQAKKRATSLIKQTAETQKKNYYLSSTAEVGENKKSKVDFVPLKDRCRSKVGTIPQSDRFVEHFQAAKGPGPGQYSPLDNMNTELKVRENHCTPSFTSKCPRDSQKATQQPEVGHYQVTREDIGEKARRMQRYLENLHHFNIARAPFNTCANRFNSSNPSQRLATLATNVSMLQQQHRHAVVRHRPEIIYNLPENPSSQFISSTKKCDYVQFDKDIVAGPTSYDRSQKWEKRSFNSNYGYNGDSKLKPTTNTKKNRNSEQAASLIAQRSEMKISSIQSKNEQVAI